VHGAAIGAAGGQRVRLLGVGERGALTTLAVDVAGESDARLVADTLGRDWPAALGLRLDDTGEPVAFDGK
jgi:uncharacterized membrane protein